MKRLKTLLGGSLLALTLLAQPAHAAAPIHFGDITWISSLARAASRLTVLPGKVSVGRP